MEHDERLALRPVLFGIRLDARRVKDERLGPGFLQIVLASDR